MVPSEKARKAGEEIAASSFPHVAEKLNATIAQFVGWPYQTASAALIDADGNKTATFSSVILAGDRSARTADEPIPADSAGAVIDVNEALDLEGLRAAYRRIVGAKSLKKTLAPNVTAPVRERNDGRDLWPCRQRLARSACRGTARAERVHAEPALAGQHRSLECRDHSICGAVTGEELTGDFLPPADGALTNYTPPCYVVMTLRPTGEYTFNRILAFLIAHLAIFSPVRSWRTGQRSWRECRGRRSPWPAISMIWQEC